MRPEMAQNTTIVIPNYNGLRFLKDCLDSVVGTAAAVILVDNASTDGSVSFVKNNYPTVSVVELPENYGFSRAVNEGIKRTETEFVLLLNSDIKAYPGFTKALEERIAGDTRVFSVNPLMLSMQNEELIDGAGDVNTIVGWPRNIGRGQRASSRTKEYDIFSSCAGASIYRTKVLSEIGMFDEKHFLYFEDVDVGWRALLLGYRNVFTPKARVLHFGSAATGGGRSEMKTFYAARNSVYILYKNLSVLQNILHMPFLLFGFLVKILFFLKKGLIKTYLKGLSAGFKLSFSTGRKCRVPAKNRTFKGRMHAEWMLIYGLFAAVGTR